MNPAKFFQITRLLLRLAKKNTPASSLKKIEKSEETTPSGLSFDTYEHKEINKGICIAVHGMSVRGKNEPRLVHFAQSMACSGITCITPTLNGLASCKWEPSDIDGMDELIKITSERYEEKIGLIGFSFGGSYCLITASHKEISKHLRYILGFSAYYDCETLIESIVNNRKTEPQTDIDWDEWLYPQLCIVKGYCNELSEIDSIDSMLERYCTGEVSIGEKKQFYYTHIRSIDIDELVKQAFTAEISKALSPAGKLAGIDCPVTLIHDRHDTLVPPIHSERLFSELQENPVHKHRMTTTAILSHVTFPGALNIFDLYRFFEAISDVF